MVIYLNPKGERILKEEWVGIDDAAYHLRSFKNERVQLRLNANRFFNDKGGSIPPEHVKRFYVSVDNIITKDFEGVPLGETKIVTDMDASRDFRTLDEAEEHYNTFLAKYTESHFDEETGKLVEVGNQLVPPNPDIPTIAEDSPMAESFGSW